MGLGKTISGGWQEFKAFAFKGNMIDLAVAVVIGAAFGKVIDAVVKDLIMPIVQFVPGLKGPYEAYQIGPFRVGHLASELLNFIVVAAAVFFIIVKLVGMIMKRAGGTPKPSEPTTKECPYCLSVIPLKALKCAHCTADIPASGVGPGAV